MSKKKIDVVDIAEVVNDMLTKGKTVQIEYNNTKDEYKILECNMKRVKNEREV